MTTEDPLTAPLLTHGADLELGLAGGMLQPPPTLEVTCIFINGLIQLVAGFPILLFISNPKEVLLAFLSATLLAVLWQKLCTGFFQPLLPRLASRIGALSRVSLPGLPTLWRRRLTKLHICILFLLPLLAPDDDPVRRLGLVHDSANMVSSNPPTFACENQTRSTQEDNQQAQHDNPELLQHTMNQAQAPASRAPGDQ